MNPDGSVQRKCHAKAGALTTNSRNIGAPEIHQEADFAAARQFVPGKAWAVNFIGRVSRPSDAGAKYRCPQ
jgi:hypothetical protein